MKNRNKLILTLVMLLALVLVVWRISDRVRKKTEEEKKALVQEEFHTYTPPKDSFPYLYHPFEKMAADDSVDVFVYQGHFKADPKPKVKTWLADGDMVFNIRYRSRPVIINTRILQLTIPAGAIIRVSAFSKDNGEKVDVLQGMMIAKKRYKSQFPEPDTVRANEMVMINDQIDLMEKEKEDLSDFAQWWSTHK